MSSDDDIRLAKSGRPFKTEEDAQNELKKLELSPEVWGVQPKDGGWALIKHLAVLAMQKEEQTKRDEVVRAKVIDGEKYFRVIFPEKSGGMDTEKVEISWQGIRITVSRGVEVVLPQRFLGVCDNAVQRVFEPGPRGTQAYVPAGIIRRRPYTKIGEAMREEFLKQWNEGNHITRAEVQAHGGRPQEIASV
jgi:hypothetical protein